SEEGGRIRHVFCDAGGGQLIAFMEPRGIPGIPVEYDAGINRGLGVPDAFYHFAFEVESLEALEAKRGQLIAKGVRVTPIVDHEWMKSIYFKDPNGLMLEYAWQVRALGPDDAVMQVRDPLALRRRSRVTAFRAGGPPAAAVGLGPRVASRRPAEGGSREGCPAPPGRPSPPSSVRSWAGPPPCSPMASSDSVSFLPRWRSTIP